jgi:lysophospholipase L1-like esterase
MPVMKSSLRLHLSICLTFVMLISCIKSKDSIVAPPNPPPAAPPVTPPVTAKKYLALGDSYTIGQNVPEADRFPVQTKSWLSNQGINVADPQIIATTGWTTTNLQNAIVTQNPSGPFDVVSLLIGVNDQYQRHDTIGYRERFTYLLLKAIQLTGNIPDRVFVLSIPDYSVTPFAMNMDTASIRMQIDWFNVINKEVTMQNFCHYLDITPSTREAAHDASLIANDGLHPSGKEYRKWSERLGTMMKAVL